MIQIAINDFDRLCKIDSLSAILEKTIHAWEEASGRPTTSIDSSELFGAGEIVRMIRAEATGGLSLKDEIREEATDL